MLTTSKFLGRSPAAFGLARSIVKAAPTDANVLIIGESGTGKEVVARAIHERSRRNEAAFIAINCGAISPCLAESELFGHEKGSFTGATSTTMGCFERAHLGTLFLDEITEMPLALQVQLLRVLENGRYHRVGGSEQLGVDVRIIAATNRLPGDAVKSGSLRSDLLYRLAVFPMRVPTLRERKADIAYLSQRFLNELNEQEHTRKRFAPESMARLESHSWPGNIRELKNVIIRAFILADDELAIPALDPSASGHKPEILQGRLKIAVGTPLGAAQRAYIIATLHYYEGDKQRTAHALGISLKTLYNRLDQFQKQGYPVPVY